MKQHDNLSLSLIIIYPRFHNLLLERICIKNVILHIYSFSNICLQENFDKFLNMHAYRLSMN